MAIIMTAGLHRDWIQFVCHFRLENAGFFPLNSSGVQSSSIEHRCPHRDDFKISHRWAWNAFKFDCSSMKFKNEMINRVSSIPLLASDFEWNLALSLVSAKIVGQENGVERSDYGRNTYEIKQMSLDSSPQYLQRKRASLIGFLIAWILSSFWWFFVCMCCPEKFRNAFEDHWFGATRNKGVVVWWRWSTK